MELKRKMCNNLMLNGNKEISEKILQKSIKYCQKFTKKNYKTVFQKSVINLTPVVAVCKVKQKNRKKNIDFPYIINKKTRISLGIKLILKKKINFIKRNLIIEIMQILIKNSDTMKIKEIEQKNAMISKKSSFFRWFY